MVALLITSVGIIGIFQVQQLIIFQEEEISHMTEALTLARTRLAEIYAARSPTRMDHNEIQNHLYQVTVSEQQVEHMDGLWLVLVTVSWDDLRGGTHQLSLSSQIVH